MIEDIVGIDSGSNLNDHWPTVSQITLSSNPLLPFHNIANKSRLVFAEIRRISRSI